MFTCQSCSEVLLAPLLTGNGVAVVYRDWLRAVGDSDGGTVESLCQAPPAPARARPFVSRPALLAATIALVCVACLVVAGGALSSAARQSIATDQGLPGADPAGVSSRPARPPRSPSRSTVPLADFLRQQQDQQLDCTVQLSLAHSFDRRSPPPDDFVCVQVADPSHPEVVVRAFASRRKAAGSLLESSLRWGDQRLATVGLTWQTQAPPSEQKTPYLCLAEVHEFSRP